MNNETLLRIHDEMRGIMIAYDHNSRHPLLSEITEEYYDTIREMIKARKEPKE